MNLILTTDCQRKCSYCFAKENINNPMQFTMENFKKAVNWLEKDIPDRIALLGGEPTLHPLFIDFLDYTLSKKLETMVFTNAMIEDMDFYHEVIKIAIKNKVSGFKNLGFCVNLNEPKYRSSKEKELQDIFFSRLGRVSSLSFNIFEETFDPYFLIDYINKYNLVKNIRLGLAMPLGNKNRYLDIKHYSEVAIKIMNFIRKATKNKIFIGFDCGFVRCMFTEGDLKELEGLKTTFISFDCGPTIDIYPNLEIASCYPMSQKFRCNLSDYTSLGFLYIDWKLELRKLKHIYDKCDTCEYLLDSKCDGGCKAYRANG